MNVGPAARPPLWPLAAGGALIAGYALLSHWLMVNAAAEPWAVAALFGPLLLAVASGAWRQRQWAPLAFCAAVLGVIVAVVRAGGVEDINRMYVLQHAAVHAALAWMFASTLRPGATPLITALAERVERTLTPAKRLYTRVLTRAWVVFFLAMIGVSFTVYALAPWPWWSLFCNLLTPLAATAFFVGEHGFRRWRHPEFERVSMRGAIEAWRAHRASPHPAPTGEAPR
jgi:uncharacterized membrane protein